MARGTTKVPRNRPISTKQTEFRVSNRLRCQLYRDQKQKYEHSLLANVAALKEELAALDRGFWQERVQLLRHVSRESIDRIMREYFTRFEYGLGSAEPSLLISGMSKGHRLLHEQTYERVRSQENFLRCLMDPHVVMDGLVGVEPMIAMMRRATAAYANFRLVLTSLEIVGSGESPMVVAKVVTHAVLTSESFRMHLPGAAVETELVRKYLHTPVAFESTMTFQFTLLGRVRHVTQESSFTMGLIESGWSIADALRAKPRVGTPATFESQELTQLRNIDANVIRQAPDVVLSARTDALWVAYPTRNVLVALVNECCELFQIRVGKTQPYDPIVSSIAAKEAFLRRVLDTDVVFGDVVGVDAVVGLWLHWAEVLACMRKQITGVSIAGADNAPVLIVYMETQLSGRLVTSVGAEMESIVPWRLLGADLPCMSLMQFHFTQDAHISYFNLDSGLTEALHAAGLSLSETSQVLEWLSSTHNKSAMLASGAAPEDEAGLQTLQKQTAKSNRERSLSFRVRQKQTHRELERSVQSLQTTVLQLKTRLNHLCEANSHKIEM